MATAIPAMPSHLHFPPELWSLTIKNFRHCKSPDELTYLWTTVRHVSRQFKEEIEAIFCTEHLPKTWLHLDTATIFHNPPAVTKVYDFNFKLHFYIIQPGCPGRAVFSLQSTGDKRQRQMFEISAYRNKTFKRLREEVEPGRLGEADKSVPGSRIRLFECPVGMFVIQVRGCVGDCALPAMNIDPSRHALSFEWRDLFSRFFGERKMTTNVLHGAQVDQTLGNAREYHPAPVNSATFHELMDQLNPSLRELAQSDGYTHLRHLQVAHEGVARIQRLSNPIQTWTTVMRGEYGKAKAAVERCQLRRQADQEIDLDDEGEINQARMDWEKENNLAADSKGVAEWVALTRACDNCRTANRPCHRGAPGTRVLRDCDFCLENGSPCNSTLACLNISRPHYVSPDPATQFLLLTQRTRQQHLMARQGQDNMGQSSPRPSPYVTMASFSDPSRHHALQDYQMQLMLLEQYNRKRRMMARQGPNSVGSTPPHSHPVLTCNSHTQPIHSSSQAMQVYNSQLSALRRCNEERLLEARLATIEKGQTSTSAPSQQTPDQQDPLLVQRHEEQPMGNRHDEDHLRHLYLPQSSMGRDSFAPMPMPTRTAASPTHPNLHPPSTDPSQHDTDLQEDTSIPSPALDPTPELERATPTKAD